MGTYREYIEAKRKYWIGKTVLYEGEFYTVKGVDYNGGLLIDKPAQFTDTTAIAESMCGEVSSDEISIQTVAE